MWYIIRTIYHILHTLGGGGGGMDSIKINEQNFMIIFFLDKNAFDS